MSKLPVPATPPAVPAADDDPLAAIPTSARSAVTTALRKLAERDPQRFARLIRTMMHTDQD